MSTTISTTQLSGSTDIDVHTSMEQHYNGPCDRQHTSMDPTTDKLIAPKNISLTRKQRQPTAPISRLPAEILAEIFERAIALDQTKFSSSDVQLEHLASVCHHWHAVLMAYPRLWSLLVFTSVGVTASMLRCSKQSPLVVKASLTGGVSQEAILLALHNLSRIRVLHIHGVSKYNQDSLIDAMKDRPAPLLESLRLISEKYVVGRMTLPPSLFANVTPRLRHFMIHRVYVPWCSPLLANLTHLEVYDNNFVPSLAEFRDVLSRCPALETLILATILPTTSGQPQCPVCLPRLSRLHLAGSLAVCDIVIQNISFPCTTAVMLYSSLAPQLPRLLTSLALSRQGIFTIALLQLKLDGTSITAQAWTTAESLSIDDPLLHLFFWGPTPTTVLHATCKGLVLTQLLSLEVEGYSLAQDGWEAILGALPNLRVLTASNADICQLISALEPVSERAVPLPGLRELILRRVRLRTSSAVHNLQACLIRRRENNAEIEKLRLIDWLESRKVDVDRLRESLWDVIEWDGIEGIESR